VAKIGKAQMINTLQFVLLYMLFWLPVTSFGAVSVAVSIEPREVSVGQQFELYLEIKSDSSVEVNPPEIKAGRAVQVLGVNQQESYSSSFSFGSGQDHQSESTKTIIYRLVATEKGEHTINLADLKVDGRIYKTSAPTIRVSDQPRREKNRKKTKNPEDDLFDQFETNDPFSRLDQMERRLKGLFGSMGGGFGQQRQNDDSIPQKKIEHIPNETMFVLTESDKKSVYVGEQLTVEWYVYVKGSIANIDRTLFPELKGFWKEPIDEVPALQFFPEIVNGKMYYKALVARHALFPIAPGKQSIDGFQIQAQVRPMESVDPLVTAKSASQKLEVNVKPLPAEGRPANFTGGVGNYEVIGTIDSETLQINQPFSYRVRVEGLGNARQIELPQIQWPSGIEVYSSRSEGKFFKNGRSYREFEVLLVPRKSGDFQLPEVQLGFFEPESSRYYVKGVQGALVHVSATEKDSPKNEVRDFGKKESPRDVKVETDGSEFQWFPQINFNRTLGARLESLTVPIAIVTLVLIGAFVVASVMMARPLRRGENLWTKIDMKMNAIEGRIQDLQDLEAYRNTGRDVLNVLNLALGGVAESSHLTIERILDSMSPVFRRKHETRIMQEFQYFETLAFAPDEMLKALMKREELKTRFEQIKTVMNELKLENPERNQEGV
jgi:hypothetical protein